MKKFLMVLAALAASSTAMAAKEETACAKRAKFGAIRAYKAEVGTVQGSTGIEYDATFLSAKGFVQTYAVSISEGNDENESWEFTYRVKVQVAGDGCKLLSVDKVEERGTNDE